MKMYFLLFLVFLLHQSITSVAAIGIYSVSTHPYTDHYKLYGSIKGGTLIYIKGFGFDINPSNNYIKLGDKFCEIEYCSENYIRCYTPAITSSEPEVAVSIEFTDYTGTVISECWSAIDCDFVYKEEATPQIQSMCPRTVSALSSLEITGAYQMSSSSQYKSTKFFDRVCQATNLNAIDYSSKTQTITCIVSDTTPVGIYNGSLLVSLGQAAVQGYGITVDDSQLFDVRVVPQIEEINGNYASVQGKSVMIQGLGFSENPDLIAVEVEGTPCQITSSSRSTITCDMPDISPISSTQFHGALGAKLKTFTLANPITPTELRDKVLLQDVVIQTESALPEFETLQSTQTNYAALAYGYFRAARTGDYKFYASCKGECQLYFQATNESIDRESMALIASAINTENRYYFAQETQISEVLSLVEGNYYYLEAYHTKGYLHFFINSKLATAGAELTVSVEIPSSDYRINSITEKVQLSVDSEIELEKFWISLYGQTGGNWSLLYLDYEDIQVSTAIPWNATCEDIVPQINKFGTSVSCVMGLLDAEGNPIVEEETNETESNETETNETETNETESNETATPTTEIGGWVYNITFLKRREVEIKLVPQTENLTTVENGTITAASNWWNHVSDPVTGTFILTLGETFTYVTPNQNLIFLKVNCTATIEELKQQFITDLGMPETIEVLEDGGNIDDGLKWQIIFTGYEGDVPNVEASDVSLVGGKTGTIPTLTITIQVDGSLNQLFEPIPADILANAEQQPQLKVTVNNYLATCNTNCDFIIDQSMTPIIDSYSQTSTGLTITLSNTISFPSLTSSQFFITFADSICTVTSIASSVITCTIPQNSDNSLQLSAGQHVPKVEILDFGFLDSSALTSITIGITIASITPEQGSPYGGQDLTITGTGFGEGIEIKLGSAVVTKIISLTNTEIKIMTPHADSSSNATFLFSLNDQTVTSASYSFITAGLPTITSLSKSTASPMIKSNVIAYGTSFGTDPAQLRCILQNTDDETIYFELNVYQAEDNQVMCILGGGIQGNYLLNIIKQGIGYAMVDPEVANAFTFQIVVTDFEPKFMGIYAGSKLVITGSGFSSVLAQNTITIGFPNMYCKVISATSTQLNVDQSYIEVPQTFNVLQRVSQLAVCQVEGGCELTFIEPILDCFEILNE